MTEKKGRGKDKDELRRKAEERLEEQTATALSSGVVNDPLRLLHELHVHQVELEMQNADLRRARDESEALLENYTELYDFAPIGYLTLDRQGTVRSINLTGAGLLGMARSHLIGRRLDHFVPAESRPAFVAFLAKVFAAPGKEAGEVTFVKEDRSAVLAQIEAVASTTGEECRMALIDITERKRVETALAQEKAAAEALSQEKAAAEAATKTKSQFLANMSHELRTPMSGVLGMLDLVLLGELPTEQRDNLEVAKKSAQALLRILNDILDFSRVEAGAVTFVEEPFSLHEALRETVKQFDLEAQRKGLDLVIDIDSSTPVTVKGDEGRVRQVLINLIGNAVKFTEHGHVALRTAAGDPTVGGRRDITFTVSDSGIGIPEEMQQRLFQPFSQGDVSHTRRYGGTGLGLTISKEVVETMGGDISLTSTVGKGSTVVVTLPLREAGTDVPAECAEMAAGQVPLPAAADAARRRLLVAEDNPILQDLLKRILQQGGIESDFVSNGEDVVKDWEEGRYDMILMDVQMPVMDGFEATRAIRAREKTRGGHIPIVALTAHAFAADRQKCLDAGMDAYVAKPIHIKDIFAVIKDLLGSKARE